MGYRLRIKGGFLSPSHGHCCGPLAGVDGWTVALTAGSRLVSHGSLGAIAGPCPAGVSGIKLLHGKWRALYKDTGAPGKTYAAGLTLLSYPRTSCLCPTKEWVTRRNGQEFEMKKWVIFPVVLFCLGKNTRDVRHPPLEASSKTIQSSTILLSSEQSWEPHVCQHAISRCWRHRDGRVILPLKGFMVSWRIRVHDPDSRNKGRVPCKVGSQPSGSWLIVLYLCSLLVHFLHFFSIMLTIVEGVHGEILNFIIVSLYKADNRWGFAGRIPVAGWFLWWLRVTTCSILPRVFFTMSHLQHYLLLWLDSLKSNIFWRMWSISRWFRPRPVPRNEASN